MGKIGMYNSAAHILLHFIKVFIEKEIQFLLFLTVVYMYMFWHNTGRTYPRGRVTQSLGASR